MKALFKRMIVALLAKRVRRLRKKHQFKVVAIAGSIGKTSTKFAIAQLLGQRFRVRYQEGNYNVPLTVPLVFFGLSVPSLTNPFAWTWTFVKIALALSRPYPYDIVVVELGTDGPGQLEEFASILRADIGILTAIAPEHMEFFGTLDQVAKEELTISTLCDTLVLNRDLLEARYVPQRAKLHGYGVEPEAEYRIVDIRQLAGTQAFSVTKSGQKLLSAAFPSIAITQLYSVCAAICVADLLGMAPNEIAAGIGRIAPVNGRMQLLRGVKNSTIIDETYNASPEAMKTALQALYDMPGGQKIALLGNMNELGNYSASAHAEIGALCDPARLALVVTLGPDSNEYLASAAEKKGCTVQRCASPYEAAECIRAALADDAVILVKGSQNKVFAEETVKQLLADQSDVAKLIRQSKYWMRRKAKAFPV